MRDEDLPFIEKCVACGRIARFAVMFPDVSRERTKYVCADHVATARTKRSAVFRIEDGGEVLT